MKTKRPNYILLFFAALCIVGFCMASYFIWIDRYIRLNGTIYKAPIIEISGRISRPNGVAFVLVNREKMYAGSISNSAINIGDSINVCYIEGKNKVIQERINPNRYYLYFGLDLILLIIGIILFIESLKGKSIWSYIK